MKDFEQENIIDKQVEEEAKKYLAFNTATGDSNPPTSGDMTLNIENPFQATQNLINKIKQETDYTALLQPVGTNIIDDWLGKNGNPEIAKQVELEAEELCKQETTLEEVAKKYATNHGMMAYIFPEKKESFIEGAKWQMERSYSEGEVKNILSKFRNDIFIKEDIDVDKWFEQFKKK